MARVVEPAATEARIRPKLGRIPVTRVVDLTPLDRLGLPVWGAVTPLALDLTTHVGKGLDEQSARVSALMEAVERTSAERAPRAATRRGSFRSLAGGPTQPLDPRRFHLPDDSRYAPDRELEWIEGFDLARRQPVLLPVDLAISPPAEGVLREVDTNGLAAGNTPLEAVVHGLCEVIERDALSQLEFTSLYAGDGDPRPRLRTLDQTTLPTLAAGWVDKIRSRGLGVELHEIRGGVDVPTYFTVLIDPDFAGDEPSRLLAFSGFGTAVDPEAALLRSLTEAVQSRTGFIQGARDSFNITASGLRPATRADQLGRVDPRRRAAFSGHNGLATQDLDAELEFLLRRLREAGFRRAVAIDLTHPELEVPVVRIRVPGLSSFYVNRRRLDWRCLRYLL